MANLPKCHGDIITESPQMRAPEQTSKTRTRKPGRKERKLNLRTGVGNKAAWGRNGEPNACNNKKKGERDDAKMKVMEMTDGKVKEMIARIQRAGIAVTSDGLRMAIAKSLEGENEAEGKGRGGADEDDAEAEGAAQWGENDYLLAEPRLAGWTTCTAAPGRVARHRNK